jgi:hypothetical protein
MCVKIHATEPIPNARIGIKAEQRLGGIAPEPMSADRAEQLVVQAAEIAVDLGAILALKRYRVAAGAAPFGLMSGLAFDGNRLNSAAHRVIETAAQYR